MEISKYKQGRLPLLISIVYSYIAIRLFSVYLNWDFSLGIGLLIIPFVWQIEKNTFSSRFFLPAILFSILALYIPAKSTLFLSLIFTSLLLVENFLGKISFSFFLLLLLISPFFRLLSDMFSFPLRLWLSDMVARTMALGGISAQASGNIIRVNGFDFYIDQACAGLNMLNVSFLICLFLIHLYQKKTGCRLHFLHFISLLSLTLLLNILSNFSRILLIVIFKIMPGTVMHDLIGLINLIIYAILPLIPGIPMYLWYFGKQTPKPSKEPAIAKLRRPALHLALLGIVTFTYCTLQQTGGPRNPQAADINIKGYKKKNLKNGVLKFENTRALIYLKTTPFYAPEHNPMICWTGSGYEFREIHQQVLNGITIYKGTLVKGKDRIYAAWWFDDGQLKTINQLHWRWQSAKTGRKFYLVNVNTLDAADLDRLTANLLPSPLTGNF